MKLGDSLGRSRKRRSSAAGETPRTESADKGAADNAAQRNSVMDGVRWLRGATGRDLLLVVGALLMAGWLIGYVVATRVFFPPAPPAGELFDVPDLRGLGFASAEERLEGAGLEMGSIDSLQHPTAAQGIVLGQSPLPGQLAQPLAEVRLTVSTGPETRRVPEVLGLEQSRARVVLETTGFTTSTEMTESDEARGTVISVAPEIGSEMVIPAEVRLTVSMGPPVVPMPTLVGLTQSEAERVVESLGLSIGRVEEVFMFGRDQGIVVEQIPDPETELEQGTPVTLRVGRRGSGREQ